MIKIGQVTVKDESWRHGPHCSVVTENGLEMIARFVYIKPQVYVRAPFVQFTPFDTLVE